MHIMYSILCTQKCKIKNNTFTSISQTKTWSTSVFHLHRMEVGLHSFSHICKLINKCCITMSRHILRVGQCMDCDRTRHKLNGFSRLSHAEVVIIIHLWPQPHIHRNTYIQYTYIMNVHNIISDRNENCDAL